LKSPVGCKRLSVKKAGTGTDLILEPDLHEILERLSNRRARCILIVIRRGSRVGKRRDDDGATRLSEYRGQYRSER